MELTPKHTSLLWHCAKTTAKLWMLQEDCNMGQQAARRYLKQLRAEGYLAFDDGKKLDRFELTSKGVAHLNSIKDMSYVLNVAKTTKLRAKCS